VVSLCSKVYALGHEAIMDPVTVQEKVVGRSVQ
jgi:hypothetical protein